MSNSINEKMPFGHQDASYKAAGEEAGIRKLCEEFYHQMSTLPEAKKIRDMHGEDLAIITDKLVLFLCMWLGGHKNFMQKYPFVPMPLAHKHLVINESERDMWLLCMSRAVEKQPYSEEFKAYLMRQLFIPAEKIRQTALKE